MAKLLPSVGKRDHVRGDLEAPIVLVEYGDFECPHCGAAEPVVRDIAGAMGPDLCVVFRHFPLSVAHPHAERAAEAAEAAGAQGKFWPMHDLIFERQDALEDENLIERATVLRLDVDRFRAELADGVHLARVKEDFASGVRSGVNGTPTFCVNGRRHDGPAEIASLLDSIERARG